MLCPLLSRHQVDPATGRGEWIHQECLGAQCKFYNIPEADCQFLLAGRSGSVALPAAGTGEALAGLHGGSVAGGGELEKMLEAAVKTPLQDVRGAQQEAADRLRRLEEGLVSKSEAEPEIERKIEAALKKTLKNLQATQELIDSRLRGLESSLASQAKDADKVRSEIADLVEAGLKKPLKNLYSTNEESGARLGRLDETLAALRDQIPAGNSQIASRIEGALEPLIGASRSLAEEQRSAFGKIEERLETAQPQLEERVKTLGSNLQEALRPLQAMGSAIGELPARQEALTQRLQAEIDKALAGHTRAVEAKIAEEFAAHSREQLKKFEAAEERAKLLAADLQEALRPLQAMGSALAELPARQEAHAQRLQAEIDKALAGHTRTVEAKIAQEFAAHSREQLKNFEAAEENSLRHHGRLLQETKKHEEAHQAAFNDLRAALAPQQGQLEGITQQVKELHLFTHDALDAARQRGEALWSQVEALARSIGPLVVFLKGLQAEIEKANTGIDSVRAENKGVLLAFHEQKLAAQEEQKRKQAETARELNNKGVTLYQRGSLEAAAEAFIRAVELRPEYAEAYNNLGLTFSKRGQADEAVRYFQKAIELDPGMGEVYNNLGFLFHTSARFDRAIEMFSRSLQTGADQSIAYTNLGNTFYKMKQNEKAVAAWKKALDIDPLNESARRGLAMFQQEPAGAPAGAHR